MRTRAVLIRVALGLAIVTLALAQVGCGSTGGGSGGGYQTSPPVTQASTVPPVVQTASGTLPDPSPFGTLPDGTKIVLLAWNDLGMHCFNADFSTFAVLPPYNNLHAQVVAMSGEEPHVITSGISVHYSFPLNTYSVGAAGKPDKSNFWTYAKAEFGADLKPDIGLTGKGLSGTMDVRGNQFVAEGIPLTDVLDSDAGTSKISPFQTAVVTVQDSSGAEVCGLLVVAPVSTEMRCDTCHKDDGDATMESGIKPSGNPYTNIVLTHDKLSADAYAKLNMKPLAERTQPFLCAECHSSNALAAKGVPGVASLSNAMHRRHSTLPDIPATTEGCYNCHPGPETKCLRDVHAETLNFQCPDCHGTLAKVATNPSPWLSEPRCDTPACHKNTPAKWLRQNTALFRTSTGMGGLACEACHDSTHALATSREAADGTKFVALQGSAGYLKKCSICHGRDSVEGQKTAHGPEGN